MKLYRQEHVRTREFIEKFDKKIKKELTPNKIKVKPKTAQSNFYMGRRE
jgi:hypothetical protein